jgi:APA family basic amino acid/polyamine antiporter
MVEMSASVQCAGGPYVFARRAFGRVGGTVIGWADFISWIVAISFMAVVFSEYCHRLGFAQAIPKGALSALLIAACWALNWTGTRASGASQTLFSAVKGGVLIALIVALAIYSGPPVAKPEVGPAIAPAIGIAALLGAMRAIVNTYAGWWTSSYFNEEMVAADRNLARATFGGIALVAMIYVGVNAALLHVLSPAAMAASELPAADAAIQVFGPVGGTLMTALAIISVAAIANLVLMLISRIGFGMARDGVLPSQLARVAKGGTPRAALTVAAVVGGVLAATGTYEKLIAVSVPLTVAIVGAVDLAAIVTRRREPDLERPFKMPLFPLPAVIGLLLNALLLAAMLVDDPFHTSAGIGAAIVLGIGYAVLGRREAEA